MKRTAIYTRVATSENAEARLRDQEKSCRAYCRRRGYEVVGVFRDVCSGATQDRPQLTALRQIAAAGAVDVVVCAEASRLSRVQAQYKAVAAELRQAGVRIKTLLDYKE